ncbi:MAG: hypothetical protein PHV34_05130 [Verrucomicrobiae bacterium]|nr:hypothetical protein [Verrucomicrobiae bacterium]
MKKMRQSLDSRIRRNDGRGACHFQYPDFSASQFTRVIPAKAGIQSFLYRALVSPKRLGEGGSNSCRALGLT